MKITASVLIVAWRGQVSQLQLVFFRVGKSEKRTDCTGWDTQNVVIPGHAACRGISPGFWNAHRERYVALLGMTP